MTYKDALELIDAYGMRHPDSPKDLRQAADLFYKAVEKQIPKKPIDNCCSVCKCSVSILDTGSIDGISRYPYCSCCGQAIDWSEKDVKRERL